MDFIKKLLAPPVFDDEEKTHRAYLLHTILLALIVVPIPYVIYILIEMPADSSRALAFILALELINIIPFILLRYGYVRSASVIQIITTWLFLTLVSITGSGIYGIAYLLGNGLVITISGILLGGTGAMVMTLFAMLEGGGMVYAELHGWTPPDIIDDVLPTWAVSVVFFTLGAVLQQLASRTLRAALARARASEEKYRLISRVSSDYVFATEVHKDGNANLSWVAGAFEKMTGYSFEEYIAIGEWPAHVHPDDAAKDAQDMETLKNNQDLRSEIRTFTKNGEIRWERIFAHPIWNENEDRLMGIVGAVQDVTEQKQTDAALAYERDLLQIFMDNIPDTVYFKDTESRFIRINQAQARFLGIEDPRDAIGKTDEDFQKHALSHEFLSEEIQIIETGKAVLNRIEYNPTNDGKSRWLSATKVPVRNSLGQVIGIIGISRDVTEERNSQEKLQKIFLQQAAILNNIPDMAWLKDIDSRYIAVNEQFVKTAGIKMEDIAGKTDFDIWRESYAEKYRKDDLEVIQTRLRKSIEEFEIDSKGREQWIETTRTPILNTNGEVIGTTGIARRITERKQAALEREKLIAELESKNAELERFTYTVSHDLKSPLVTIKGFLGYLERDARTGNYEKLKHDTQRIESAVEKMQNLLKDLLELSRVGRVMNTPVEIPFNEIVKDALEIVEGQVKAGKVRVDYKTGNIMVKCDRIRLTEVMQNLIDNAIKFMGTQSSPHIEIGHFLNDNHENVFYVKDNGAGIAPEFHGKIFGLFDKLTADSDGTGIGLALVKRIIEVHGGRIWVESQVGSGAVFYFTLP